MSSPKALEILHTIAETWIGSAINNDVPLMSQLSDTSWSERLSQALREEMNVTITAKEIELVGSLFELSHLLESRLARDAVGRSLIEIYAIVERLAKEEYNPDISYGWYARWNDFLNVNNWLTAPDALDSVEVVMRMEEEFGFSIPNNDAEAMETVGQTVRYLWRRNSQQSFILRHRGEDVCRSAFVFYELRRLLMIRGGIPRSIVQLDSRLDELLPSWYSNFWKQVQDIFHVDLRRSRFLFFKRRVKKETTVKTLTSLIASSQDFCDFETAHQEQT